jgi:hypothetical protein
MQSQQLHGISLLQDDSWRQNLLQGHFGQRGHIPLLLRFSLGDRFPGKCQLQRPARRFTWQSPRAM